MTAPDTGGPVAALAIAATTATGTFTVTATFRTGAGTTVLFGPSGSGKSVTLATIAGLLRPATGTVVLDGETVADAGRGIHVPTQERRIGMVFQHAALLPHRSPLDNVALAVRSGDRESRRRTAATWLERVQGADLATAPTATLSGGEQQRVSLARALAGEPRLLLLDEPFSAVDQATRTALRRLVRTLTDEQRIATLIVTHDVADVMALADRLVMFEPGRTIAAHDVPPGDPTELARLLGLGGDGAARIGTD